MRVSPRYLGSLLLFCSAVVAMIAAVGVLFGDEAGFAALGAMSGFAVLALQRTERRHPPVRTAEFARRDRRALLVLGVFVVLFVVTGLVASVATR